MWSSKPHENLMLEFALRISKLLYARISFVALLIYGYILIWVVGAFILFINDPNLLGWQNWKSKNWFVLQSRWPFVVCSSLPIVFIAVCSRFFVLTSFPHLQCCRRTITAKRWAPASLALRYISLGTMLLALPIRAWRAMLIGEC